MIKWFEKNRWISLILTVLISIEIFYFSSISGPQIGKGLTIMPTMYHFIVFFLFSFFLFITLKKEDKIKAKYIIAVLIISIIYAILDEFHQIFVLYRDASIKDILIDGLGIFSAVIIYSHINKKSNM